MRTSLLQLTTSLIGIAALTSATSAQDLSWEQLVAQRHLWPMECKITEEYEVGSRTLGEGKKYDIVFMGEDWVLVEVSTKDKFVRVPYDHTDVLEVANAEAAAMSPELRELSYEKLAQRADLWPDRVEIARPLKLRTGDKVRRVKPGTKYLLGCLTYGYTRLGGLKKESDVEIEATYTDLMQQARKAFSAKPIDPGDSRLIRELNGNLIDLGNKGRKAKIDSDNPPDYFLIYASAGWCGPCRKFSPQLVNFYKSQEGAGETFQVVFLSRDHSKSEMENYAEHADFPWLAVKHDKRDQIPMLQACANRGIPHLLMMDTYGSVLFDSYKGSEYLGPSRALAGFQQLLAAPKPAAPEQQ